MRTLIYHYDKGTEVQCEKKSKSLCNGASDVEGSTDCEAVVEETQTANTSNNKKRKGKQYNLINGKVLEIH